MQSTRPVEVPAASFRTAAETVVSELQASLSALFAALPGSIRRAVDVERSLGLDKKLAWQLFRLVNSTALTDASNVPGLPSIRRLVEAAKRRKVPKEVIDRVSAAFERFEEFAVQHAGDRDGLTSLLSGISSEKNDQYEVKVRRALFRSNAHVWGTQSEMQVRTAISMPKPPPHQVEDVALIMGDIGLQRMRESEPLTMVRWARTGDSPRNRSAEDAANPTAPLVDHGVGLLHEFCTHPLPAMLPKESVLGGVETELVIPTGRAGAVTIYSMQIHENAETTPHAFYDGRTFITTPVETLVWDLLIPVGLTDPATARVVVYGRRPHPEQVYEERVADLLPQRETVHYLGAHDAPPVLEGAHRYHEAVQHVLRTLGWFGTKFDIYRCRVQYPVLHTLVCMRVDAAKRA
jgi:hypothetical protein